MSDVTIIILYFLNFMSLLLLLPLHVPDITTLLSSLWFFTHSFLFIVLTFIFISFSPPLLLFFSFLTLLFFPPFSSEVVSCRVALSYKLESSQHL